MFSRFTLIELLVTIAIISILMAIMLPGLKLAKTAANSVFCKNSQKQINNCLQFYANDWDECFPGHQYGPSGHPSLKWYETLASENNLSSSAIGGILRCPGTRQSYSVSHGMNGNAMWAWNQNVRLKTKRMNCHRPSAIFLTQDADMDIAYMDKFRYLTFNKRANVSFVDAHIQDFSADEYAMSNRTKGVSDGGWDGVADWSSPIGYNYW